MSLTNLVGENGFVRIVKIYSGVLAPGFYIRVEKSGEEIKVSAITSNQQFPLVDLSIAPEVYYVASKVYASLGRDEEEFNRDLLSWIEEETVTVFSIEYKRIMLEEKICQFLFWVNEPFGWSLLNGLEARIGCHLGMANIKEGVERAKKLEPSKRRRHGFSNQENAKVVEANGLQGRSGGKMDSSHQS